MAASEASSVTKALWEAAVSIATASAHPGGQAAALLRPIMSCRVVHALRNLPPPPLPPSPPARARTRALASLQIPVQLRLAEDEVSSLEQPPTLYVSPLALAVTLQHAALPHSCGCRRLLAARRWQEVSQRTRALPARHPRSLAQMLVPRQGYLHSLVPQALRLLQHLLPPGDDAPWFEAGALPLRWGVPAGVLYDLLEGPGGRLPWRLTIHFRSYPSK